jgi:hypothetical protein
MNRLRRLLAVAMLSSTLAACGGTSATRTDARAGPSVAVPVDTDSTGAYVGRVCRYGYLPVQACRTTEPGYVGGACTCPSVGGGTFTGKIVER